MKPLPVIISLVLATISVLKLANTCSKRAGREKSNEFMQQRMSIERKRQAMLRYDKNDADSIEWMAAHKEFFDEALDSSIKYYRDNYYDDEERNKTYLKTLYAYKKISYLYKDWIKYNREYAATKKKDTLQHKNKYRSFYNDSRDILHRMNMDNITSGY